MNAPRHGSGTGARLFVPTLLLGFCPLLAGCAETSRNAPLAEDQVAPFAAEVFWIDQREDRATHAQPIDQSLVTDAVPASKLRAQHPRAVALGRSLRKVVHSSQMEPLLALLDDADFADYARPSPEAGWIQVLGMTRDGATSYVSIMPSSTPTPKGAAAQKRYLRRIFRDYFNAVAGFTTTVNTSRDYFEAQKRKLLEEARRKASRGRR